MYSKPPHGKLMRTIFSILILVSFIVPLIFSSTGGALAETVVYDGSARSQVHIIETTTITIENIGQITNGSKFVFNATCPTASPVDGYSNSYSNVQISASPTASKVSKNMVDHYGNPYWQYEWDSDKINTGSTFRIVVTTSFDADITGQLGVVSYDDPLGTSAYPEYQSPTGMVQSTAPSIVSTKNQILSGVTSEAVAVNRIMDYVKTNIPQDNQQAAKDAVSSLGSQSGNCVNRAHLALALLRSAGIPARCVSGLLYSDSYSVSYPNNVGTVSRSLTWGSGSHVWVEVYYPQENVWVPYDPFMDKGFVDSRHVKLATSIDYANGGSPTRGDAGVLYIAGMSSPVKPNLDVSVSTSNLHDSLSLHYRYTIQSPAAFMMAREMQSSTAPTPTPTPVPGNSTPTPVPGNSTATPLPGNMTPTPTLRPWGSNSTPYPLDSPAVNYGNHNVSGVIVDASTGKPVPGATVRLDTIQVSASDDGNFAFLYAVANDSYTISVSAPGYVDQSQVIIPKNADVNVTIKMARQASATQAGSQKRTPAPGLILALAALAGGALLWKKKDP